MALQLPLNSPRTRSTTVLLPKASARLLWTTETIVGCLQRPPEGLENGNSQRWSGGELRNTLLLLLACLVPHHTTPHSCFFPFLAAQAHKLKQGAIHRSPSKFPSLLEAALRLSCQSHNGFRGTVTVSGHQYCHNNSQPVCPNR